MTGRSSRRCFRKRPAPAVWRKHPEPDWAQIHRNCRRTRDLTLLLVLAGRTGNDPDGYGYSASAICTGRWLKKLDLVARQEHRAGEKMFVDYAGATIPIHDPQSGEVHPAAVFVAVLGASSYTFAEATSGQDLRSWTGSHMRAFEFFGGVVEVVVPDNLKSAVTHPSYYEPDLNPTYRDLGEHYGVAIIPARLIGQDKAKAEVGVQVVQRWIVAGLAQAQVTSPSTRSTRPWPNCWCGSTAAVSQARGNRASLFAQLEPAALKPLPATRYPVRSMEDGRLSHRLHIEIERHYYSVPYALVHQEVDAHLTAETLEVPPPRAGSVACRSYEPGKSDHPDRANCPRRTRSMCGRTPSRLIERCQQKSAPIPASGGSHPGAKRHPEMGYPSCLGILRSAKNLSRRTHGSGRATGSAGSRYNFRSMDSILRNQLDRLPGPEGAPGDPPFRRPWSTQHPRRRLLRFAAEADSPVIQ